MVARCSSARYLGMMRYFPEARARREIALVESATLSGKVRKRGVNGRCKEAQNGKSRARRSVSGPKTYDPKTHPIPQVKTHHPST